MLRFALVRLAEFVTRGVLAGLAVLQIQNVVAEEFQQGSLDKKAQITLVAKAKYLARRWH